MRYKQLGRTGLLVSELCFGTMTFGGGRDFWLSDYTTDSSLRPMLVIDYQPPVAEPAGLGLMGLALLGLKKRRS